MRKAETNTKAMTSKYLMFLLKSKMDSPCYKIEVIRTFRFKKINRI